MNEFLLVAGMAAVTFIVRYPVLVLVSRIPMPDRVFRALRYVPPAVLAAIIAPALLMPDGETIHIAPDNAYLLAGIAAGLLAWRTKNPLLTIVAGMALFLILRALTGA